MKAHLFYTFLVIFAATSVVTLLGVTNVIAIREGYLTALVAAFLIELAGAVIAIFKGADFFTPDSGHITADESVRTSIRKLDSAIGHLFDRLTALDLHFQSRLLSVPHLGPTPRTDIMVLVPRIQASVGKVPAEVISEPIGAIADVLESGVDIGSSEKAALISLCHTLPSEFSGLTSRLLKLLEK